ncbi:hypothetical protein R3W88_034056 [Solanum pinnatisectum]|uniref:Integrase SAM-like N-terminal domain-containing protein n=1 Tax=Solanum pinnatisectum TaxID=50273 RepID=A0AAV9JZB0_9SOLN|nr:hypothetical protein R3W88_034056 [Solanum pinnatisectum]
MARPLGTCNEEIVMEFYASFAATVRGSISRKAKPAAQPLLEAILVWGFSVDISETTLCRFIYGLDKTQPINTTEFDYRMGIIQIVAF